MLEEFFSNETIDKSAKLFFSSHLAIGYKTFLAFSSFYFHDRLLAWHLFMAHISHPQVEGRWVVRFQFSWLRLGRRFLPEARTWLVSTREMIDISLQILTDALQSLGSEPSWTP